MTEELDQVRKIQQAFEQEFGRFADLRVDGISLTGAEALLREVGELKVKSQVQHESEGRNECQLKGKRVSRFPPANPLQILAAILLQRPSGFAVRATRWIGRA